MVTLANTYEGGSNAIAISTANSGGASGNAFDVVTAGAGASVTYDAAAPHGLLCGLYSVGGSSVVASTSWTSSIGAALPRMYGRLVGNAASFAVLIPALRMRGGGVQSARITINTAGKVELRNTANTILATSTTALTPSASFMLRWDIAAGAAAAGAVYIHTNPASDTPTETLSVSGANFGAANIDEVNVGIVVATTGIAGWRIDDLVATDIGLPGAPAFIGSAMAATAAGTGIPSAAAGTMTGSVASPQITTSTAGGN